MINRFSQNDYKQLLKTDCNVIIYQEGLSEEGSPLESLNINSKCRFVEKTKRVITPEGKSVVLVGKVILAGDIAPSVFKITGGEVIINNAKYEIYQASRPRNPDGTVHHTTLEMM